MQGSCSLKLRLSLPDLVGVPALWAATRLEKTDRQRTTVSARRDRVQSALRDASERGSLFLRQSPPWPCTLGRALQG